MVNGTEKAKLKLFLRAGDEFGLSIVQGNAFISLGCGAHPSWLGWPSLREAGEGGFPRRQSWGQKSPEAPFLDSHSLGECQ